MSKGRKAARATARGRAEVMDGDEVIYEDQKDLKLIIDDLEPGDMKFGRDLYCRIGSRDYNRFVLSTNAWVEVNIAQTDREARKANSAVIKVCEDITKEYQKRMQKIVDNVEKAEKARK